MISSVLWRVPLTNLRLSLMFPLSPRDDTCENYVRTERNRHAQGQDIDDGR
jgi:hypothetical protein